MSKAVNNRSTLALLNCISITRSFLYFCRTHRLFRPLSRSLSILLRTYISKAASASLSFTAVKHQTNAWQTSAQCRHTVRPSAAYLYTTDMRDLNPDLRDLFSWNLAHQLLPHWETFVPNLCFQRLSVCELEAGTEQTDGRTDGRNL